MSTPHPTMADWIVIENTAAPGVFFYFNTANGVSTHEDPAGAALPLAAGVNNVATAAYA